MLELSAKTNLLEENDYRYSLQDVKDPVLYRDVYNYDEVPKVAFNHRRVPMSMPADIWITDTSFRDGQQSMNPYTPEQIEQLRQLVDEENLPVLCFGLRTDFLTHLFPGSRRLFELADSITEIKTICECGSKATVNARIDGEGHVVTEGAQVFLGGNDSYIAMCHACWRKRIARERAERAQK